MTAMNGGIKDRMRNKLSSLPISHIEGLNFEEAVRMYSQEAQKAKEEEGIIVRVVCNITGTDRSKYFHYLKTRSSHRISLSVPMGIAIVLLEKSALAMRNFSNPPISQDMEGEFHGFSPETIDEDVLEIGAVVEDLPSESNLTLSEKVMFGNSMTLVLNDRQQEDDSLTYIDQVLQFNDTDILHSAYLRDSESVAFAWRTQLNGYEFLKKLATYPSMSGSTIKATCKMNARKTWREVKAKLPQYRRRFDTETIFSYMNVSNRYQGISWHDGRFENSKQNAVAITSHDWDLELVEGLLFDTVFLAEDLEADFEKAFKVMLERLRGLNDRKSDSQMVWKA